MFPAPFYYSLRFLGHVFLLKISLLQQDTPAPAALPIHLPIGQTAGIKNL